LVHGLLELAVIRSRRFHDDERGAIAVITAIVLVLMLAVLALVIDLGNARQQRREAQNGADAAALAGGESIEAGNGTIVWDAVVAQVKNYARVNDHIPASAWIGCSDPAALSYKPDSANSDACISADLSAWPVASAANVGNTSNRLRVRLPSTSVKSYFAKAVGNHDLTTGASATATVVMTVQQISTASTVAGGPCALCILGTGFTLDGQNGDVTIAGGNVIVNSTYTGGSCHCAAKLNPNGHVTLTLSGGVIGGPGAPGNFSGAGYSPPPSLQGAVVDPLANVPQCGDGTPGSVNYCPTTNQSNGTTNNAPLNPGIYTTISGSHTLSKGVYIIKSGITLNGNDLLQGDGVMLYFACSGYPAPCNSSGQSGAGITATGNGAIKLTAPTAEDCTANSAICPYVGMLSFADRNNTATQTWRGNGTNENGAASALSGTIYMKSGQMDLRGNGYQMASQIVVDNFTMNGNPSTVTIAYDLSKNYSETHTVGTTSYGASYDNNGLSG
jgi:Putative Flp pilus-assembly TadE/G-like